MRCVFRGTRALTFLLLAAPLASGGSGSHARSQVSVLTQHNNEDRTGANLNEVMLRPSNVSGRQFGMLFRRVVDDQVYGQPLVVSGVKVRGGTHDLVYVTTVNNSVYAFDANDPSAQGPVWHVNFGTPPNIYDGRYGCSDMNGNMGIIGTPVVDAQSGMLYVVATTRVGNGFLQRLHALDLATGSDAASSPATITAPGFAPLMQSQRPGLVLSQGKVFIGYASHCDKEPYHGFLFSYDAKTLRQIGVFNTSPQGQAASIWQFGQAPAVDAQGNIYFVTGNGSWNGATDFSESFLKLDPNLRLLDWFTPTNHAHLDVIDADLNCSGAVLIPGTSLVIDAGKQGVLYVVNTHHMGHLGDEHAVQHFQATSSQLPSLVYWNSAQHGGLIYMWGQADRLRSYRVTGDGVEEKPFAARTEVTEGHPGAMLSLSANGDKDGILWAAIHLSGSSWHESRPGILHAYDADDISHELWNSLENPGRDDCNNYAKTAAPAIANGKVYLASFGTRNTGSGQLCVYGLLPNGDPPSPPSSVNVSAEDRLVSLSWPASRDAVTYTVRRTSENAASPETIASGLTSTWFTDQTAGNGATYEYTVSSVNSNGESRPSASMAVSLPNPPMPVSVFPPGAGRDLTMKVCSGCHSPGLAAKQHLSPQEWRDLVRFMAAQGAVATDNQLNQIAAYLAKNFPRQVESGQRKEER
jgi:mono/diheme cytochrome c family protein